MTKLKDLCKNNVFLGVFHPNYAKTVSLEEED